MSERDQRKYESVYSKTVRAGKRRTYFFDVKQTKGNDYYLTITESKKRFEDGGYERHKIFLYKEDFNRFLEGLNEAVEYVKMDLMPDYDYDEYTRRHEEYQEGMEHDEMDDDRIESAEVKEAKTESYSSFDIEEDLAW